MRLRAAWMQLEPAIQTSLYLTAAFLVAIFLFSFTSGCPSGEDCKKSGYSYFLNASPNEVGDSLAGVAGALAFLWLITTVFVQAKELKEQRQEISITNNHLDKQNFDNFFFELISTHNEIVGAMDIRSSGPDGGHAIRQGRDCFGFFANFLELETSERLYARMADDKTMDKYRRMYENYRSDLGHYFRFVHNSMRAIDESPLAQKNHRRLYRPLFSDDELLLLFYNSQTELGKGMLPFLESFALFDNLPIDRLILPAHKEWVSGRCFGDPQ